MDFQHSEDRQILTSSLSRLLADRNPIETRNHHAFGSRGFNPELWNELVEMGVVGALFSEAAGGYGGDGLDIMVVFEAIGQGLSTEPLLGSLMAGLALEGAGRHEELAQLIEGRAIGTFLDDSHPEQPLTARRTDEGYVLSGTSRVTSAAEVSSLFVVKADLGGEDALFLITPATTDLSLVGYNTIDGGRAADVTLNDVAVEASVRLDEGRPDLVGRVLAGGRLALAAEALGTMDRIREDTVGYLQTRVQFGMPIGRFQALQHRMATVLLEIEQARSAVINAALAYDEEPAGRDKAISAAKYTTGHIGTLVAEEAIQMHGGIGMTWELALPHYAKRLIMLDHRLGDEDWHLQRFIELSRA